MFKQKIDLIKPNKKLALEQKVAQTIVELLDNGIKPTGPNIISRIGGSFSTVGPILKKLKIDYQDFKKVEVLCKDFGLERENRASLLIENKTLKNQLESLNEYVKRLESRVETFDGQFEKLKLEKEHFKKLFESLEKERTEVLADVRAQKDKHIERLMDELGQTHQSHSEAYRALSSKQHDKDMQKEIELMNLKERHKRQEAKLTSLEQKTLPQIKKIQHLESENAKLVAENEKLMKKLRESADV